MLPKLQADDYMIIAILDLLIPDTLHLDFRQFGIFWGVETRYPRPRFRFLFIISIFMYSLTIALNDHCGLWAFHSSTSDESYAIELHAHLHPQNLLDSFLELTRRP